MIDNALRRSLVSQSIPFALPVSPSTPTSTVTSDGGLCWLSEADTALGLCALLAGLRVATEQDRPS